MRTGGSRLVALEAILEGADGFGGALKAPPRISSLAHPGEPIADLGQILPFLKDSEKFVAPIRPAFAQFEYLSAHDGQPPADPSQLRPYLGRPFNPTEALPMLKRTWDSEYLTMIFD